MVDEEADRAALDLGRIGGSGGEHRQTDRASGVHDGGNRAPLRDTHRILDEDDPTDPGVPTDPVVPGDPFGRSFGYQNGGGGISRGFEVSAHMSPTSRTNIGLSYTYLNADSDAPTIGADYYKVLGQSPNMFTATAAQWIGQRVSISFDMSAYSKYTNTISGAGDRQFVFDAPVKARFFKFENVFTPAGGKFAEPWGFACLRHKACPR